MRNFNPTGRALTHYVDSHGVAHLENKILASGLIYMAACDHKLALQQLVNQTRYITCFWCIIGLVRQI